jgi:hypothetical protein
VSERVSPIHEREGEKRRTLASSLAISSAVSRGMKKNVTRALRMARPLPTKNGPEFPRSESGPPKAKRRKRRQHRISTYPCIHRNLGLAIDQGRENCEFSESGRAGSKGVRAFWLTPCSDEGAEFTNSGGDAVELPADGGGAALGCNETQAVAWL